MAKRILAFALALMMLFLLSACAENSLDTFESAMTDLRNADTVSFADKLTEDSLISMRAVFYMAENMSESSAGALSLLLSEIRFTVDKEKSTQDTIYVKMTAVRFDSLISYLENLSAIGGSFQPEKAVTNLRDSGKLAALYMQTDSFAVTMKKDEKGNWKIPYTVSENKELVDFLNLSVAIRFFAK